MKTETLKAVQTIPATLEEAWDFFATPANLQKITPKEMRLEVLSNLEEGHVYPGQIIKYHVYPILGIKMLWVSEITEVEEKKLFVDEQRKGPYAVWHHQHNFREVEGGVEMTDILTYSVPFGFLGSIAKALYVKRQVEKIFSHRYQTIENHFGKPQ